MGPFVLLREDAEGVPFAVEVVEASAWDDRMLEPPPIDVADVRIVRLPRPGGPARPPRWLRIVVGAAPITDAAESLWPWSPYYRPPSSGADEFLLAGATALRHPEPPPTSPLRQLEALSAFARGTELLRPLLHHRQVALTRWFQARFREPEVFAEEILLARLADIRPAYVPEFRFLRAASVPREPDEHRALSVDRDVLLDAAALWELVEGAELSPHVLTALKRWRYEYARGYAQAYRSFIEARDRLLESSWPIERLARSLASATCCFEESECAEVSAAAERFTRLATCLRNVPDEPDPSAPVSGGVAFERPTALLDEFRAAREVLQGWGDLQLHRAHSNPHPHTGVRMP